MPCTYTGETERKSSHVVKELGSATTQRVAEMRSPTYFAMREESKGGEEEIETRERGRKRGKGKKRKALSLRQQQSDAPSSNHGRSTLEPSDNNF